MINYDIELMDCNTFETSRNNFLEGVTGGCPKHVYNHEVAEEFLP